MISAMNVMFPVCHRAMFNHFSKTCFSKENFCDFLIRNTQIAIQYSTCVHAHGYGVYLCVCAWMCLNEHVAEHLWVLCTCRWGPVFPLSAVFLDRFPLFFWDRVSQWICSFSICLGWSLSFKVLSLYSGTGVTGKHPLYSIFMWIPKYELRSSYFMTGTWYLLPGFLLMLIFIIF